ncbi:MAG: DUF3516 domain-containing protein [Vicinamibacterales bacterium]
MRRWIPPARRGRARGRQSARGSGWTRSPPSTASRADPEARSLRHTHVTRQADSWQVQQMLVDAEMVNDWVADFVVDLAASRARQQPVVWLRDIGPLA